MPNNHRVLLIDDDINLSKVISYQLEKNGFPTIVANNGEDGLALFNKKAADIVITDIQMPGISGIEVLNHIRHKNPQTIVILITAFGSVDNAIEACKLGADDYLTKPFGQEQLLFVIEKALKLRELSSENKRLQLQLEEKFDFSGMIFQSEEMKQLVQTAVQAAQTDSTVLLLGESGTGKELLAKAIHFNSPRKEKVLITVNCPAIPDNLLESELFGHVKGAFTGAINNREGKFQLANGGTIFLDEIADLKMAVQAKLLRVLQEREVEKLGQNGIQSIDVRIITATNKNLAELVKAGKFREDLFHRLNVVPLTLPALRDRTTDIPVLTDYFFEKIKPGYSYHINQSFYDVLKKYDWPGNIRELENLVERLIATVPGSNISAADLPPHLQAAEKLTGTSRESDAILSLDDIQKNAIMMALKKTSGNQTKAAKLLNIPRHVLIYRMKKLDIQ